MSFSLGICSQLPKGTSPALLERLLRGTLTPLLQHLYRNAGEKLVFSISGCEMEWLEASHPEINVLINSLARRGQIEFLTSSYNALRLGLLPSGDRASEIEKTSAFIRRRYSKRAEGLWVVDQIWSPSFIPLMNLCSLGYVVISASPQAGPRVKRPPFLMDEKGKAALVVPTNDEVSRIVRDGALARKSSADLAQEVARVRVDRNALVDLVMVNADQLLYDGADGFSVAMAALARYQEKGIATAAVDHKALLRREVLDFGYLPEGIYGCDGPSGAVSPDEAVLEGVFKRSAFKFFERLRLQTKMLPLDKNVKKELGQHLVRCLGRCPFADAADARLLSKTFFEARGILEGKKVGLPGKLDFDNDGFDEVLLQNDSLALLVDGKGGSICALFSRREEWELLKSRSALPLFSDAVTTPTGKILRLRRRRYALEAPEGAGQASCALEDWAGEGLRLSLRKTFVLKEQALRVEVEVQNNSDKSAAFKHSLALPLGEGVRLSSPPDAQTLLLRIEGRWGAIVCEGEGARFRAVADGPELPYTGHRIQWELRMKPKSLIKTALTFKTGESDDTSEQEPS